ncbi:hypothetical protein VaNZ11_015394, partial [Volvox africanus]
EEGDDRGDDDEMEEEQATQRRGRPENASSAYDGGQRGEGSPVVPPSAATAAGGKARRRGPPCRAPPPDLMSGGGGGSGADADAATFVCGARIDLGYNQRLLPVSWLLQCLGEVSEPLRCLWPQHRQEEVRAHVLAAAARSFAHLHPDIADATHVRYIHQSPLVLFVRDCFASTPRYARLQLLEDAMRLTAAPPREHPTAVVPGLAPRTTSPPADSAKPQVARGPPSHCGLMDTDSKGAVEGGSQTGQVEHLGEGPPNKRRRLMNTPQVPAAQALHRPQTSPSLSQPTTQQESGEQPLPDPVPATGAHGGGTWLDLGQRGRSQVPWAALLAHMSEEEEGTQRSPNQHYVMSPLALCELLLARGDLFGPADVEAAGYCLLRCLTSLEPSQTAELVTRVLACPSSATPPFPNATPKPERAPPYGSGAVSPIAPGPTYTVASCAPAVGVGGGLAAALAVLRRPLRPGAALLPVKAVLRTKRGGRWGSGKAANAKAAGAAASAEEVVELVTDPPPAPLTALWLLSHVIPVLMGALEHEDEEAEADEAGTARAGGRPDVGNRDGSQVLTLDIEARARALASLAALLRQPELLLPETRPEELPAAVRVLAMQIRGLGASGRGGEGRGSDAGARSRGENVTGAAVGASVDRCNVPLRRLATLLCRSFGQSFGLDDSDGGDSGGRGRLKYLVQCARGDYARSLEAGSQLPLPGVEPAHNGRGQAWRRPTRGSSQKLATLASPIWPAMRPLLALLDHLPHDSHVATAIHELLFAALLQRCPPSGSERGRSITPVNDAHPDGTETAAATVAAKPAVTGMDAGAVAAEGVLGLLLGEAIPGIGKEVPLAAPPCALQLSASAKLNVLRLVVLAAEAASHRDEDTAQHGVPAAAAMEVASGEVAVPEAQGEPGGQREQHKEESPLGSGDGGDQNDPWVMPPTTGAAAVGTWKYNEVQMVQVVLERLGNSIVAVAEVLRAAEQRAQPRPGAAVSPALPAASSSALATGLSRVAPQALLVRMAAGVVAAAASREGVESAKGTVHGRGTRLGPAMGSRTSATITTTTADAPTAWEVGAAAEAVVRLLRLSAPGMAVLQPFMAEAPAGRAGMVAVGGLALLASSSSSGGGGGGTRMSALLQGQHALEPRMTGLQLVQHTQQALRLLAAAACNCS